MEGAKGRDREKEKDIQTDRQTNRENGKEGKRENGTGVKKNRKMRKKYITEEKNT